MMKSLLVQMMLGVVGGWGLYGSPEEISKPSMNEVWSVGYYAGYIQTVYVWHWGENEQDPQFKEACRYFEQFLDYGNEDVEERKMLRRAMEEGSQHAMDSLQAGEPIDGSKFDGRHVYDVVRFYEEYRPYLDSEMKQTQGRLKALEL